MLHSGWIVGLFCFVMKSNLWFNKSELEQSLEALIMNYSAIKHPQMTPLHIQISVNQTISPNKVQGDLMFLGFFH